MANKRTSDGDTNPKSKYHRLYSIWIGARRRCKSDKHKDFLSYGAKGISICSEWDNSYVTFKKWALNNNYNDSKTLDRIETSGDYKPENCRWASPKQQCRNKKNNIVIRYQNRIITLAELADMTGIPRGTIKDRYRRHGLILSELIKERVEKKYITLSDGFKINRRLGAKMLNIKYETILSRYRKYGDDYKKLGFSD